MITDSGKERSVDPGLGRRSFIRRSSLLSLCAISALHNCAPGRRDEDPDGLVFSAQGEGFRLLVSDQGAMAVEVGGESYVIESSYSYPDEGKVGANELSWARRPRSWEVKIRPGDRAQQGFSITGKAKHYTLTRNLAIEGSRLSVSDEIVNETNESIGVLIRHRVVTADEPTELLFSGAPWNDGAGGAISELKDVGRRAFLRVGLLEQKVGYQADNPTLFLSLKRSNVGVVAEDTLSRLQFEAHRYRAAFSIDHLALRPLDTVTLKWAVYPQGSGTDYFTFINKVRSDWKTNFTIAGPFDFFPLIDHEERLDKPAQLDEYLKRRRLRYGVVALAPWIDYDNYSWRTGKNLNREEYKKLMQAGMRAFKAIDPGIKCVGCMQSCWRSLPADVTARMYEEIPTADRRQGFFRFTEAQMKIAQDLPSAWKDSLTTGPDGRYIYELYYVGPNTPPQMAIGTYAADGNSQLDYWMDQVHFIMEDVGLDGIYIDGFSLAFKADPSQRYTYDRWDRRTVDIDARTGEIRNRYTDCALVGVQAQQRLIEYVQARSGILVANTAASAEEVQASPVMRFLEGSGVMGHFRFNEGTEPPLFRLLCRGQLGSPIGLGWSARATGSEDEGPEYIKKVMATAITYLRHGLLYYYYDHQRDRDTPLPQATTASNPDEYGAINHMFPITPAHIGKGFVVGKERIVTAVSGRFSWSQDRKPRVLCFDMENRSVKSTYNLQRKVDGWSVTLQVHDWREIYIVE